MVFIGDSIVRSAYHGFLATIDPKYEQNHSYVFKHQDIATRSHGRLERAAG